MILATHHAGGHTISGHMNLGIQGNSKVTVEHPEEIRIITRCCNEFAGRYFKHSCGCPNFMSVEVALHPNVCHRCCCPNRADRNHVGAAVAVVAVAGVVVAGGLVKVCVCALRLRCLCSRR